MLTNKPNTTHRTNKSSGLATYRSQVQRSTHVVQDGSLLQIHCLYAVGAVGDETALFTRVLAHYTEQHRDFSHLHHTPAGLLLLPFHIPGKKLYDQPVSEQCFTSPPTQHGLYGRRFLQVKKRNQQYQSTEGRSRKDKENNENN